MGFLNFGILGGGEGSNLYLLRAFIFIIKQC